VAYAPITTNNQSAFRRLRTDNEKTEFFTGREFRSFVELSLGNGATISFKITSLVDFVLYDQELDGLTGSLKLEFYSGGTETVAFSTPVTVFAKNQMAQRPQPYYTTNITIGSGGTFTGGTKEGILYAIVGTNNGQNTNASMSKDVHDARGFAAGNYYVRITNLNAGSPATGVYKLWWAER
jgi:hypothetical protein